MDKVVVIGGSGFIGSHIADELTQRGFETTIFDNRVSPWLQDSQEMVVGDIRDRALLTNTVKGARYLYLFAGIADIHEAGEHPYDAIELNVMGAAATIEAGIAAGVERFLYASTMYVYSRQGSFYRASKQAAETVIEAYHERYGLDYTLLRYGSLYGPRAQEWNGLQRYVRQIVLRGEVDYHGSGRERREYIHALDAARLSVDILDQKHRNKAITLTGSQVLSSRELIEMIFEIAGVEQNVNFSDDEREEFHYGMTPYRYTPKPAMKLVPSEFIDLGQGVLEVVEAIHQEHNSS